MVSTNDIRPGQSILVDGIIYQIIEYQHVKPGKGKAFVKTKLKNLTNGGVLDKTFRADEDVEQAYIDKQTFQYLYNDADKYFFMNADSYEQIELSKDQIIKICDRNFLGCDQLIIIKKTKMNKL